MLLLTDTWPAGTLFASATGHGKVFMLTLRCVILLMTVALLAGCGRDDSRTGAALREVRIGYFANLSHAQGLLGVDSGEFAAAVAPAQLKTRIFNAGPSLIEALFAGEIDIGYVGPGPAINGFVRSRGQALRIIAGASANGVLIVARKDSGIATLDDLRGRKIATPQRRNTQDISALHYVLKVLKQPKADNVVAIPNAEQSGLMRQGQIDAAWVPEPWASRLVVEAGASIIAHEKDMWPDGEFALAVVVVSPRFLREQPQVVEKLLAAHRTWTARLSEDATAYVGQLGQALFRLTGNQLPPGVLEQAVRNVKFTDEPLEQTLRTMAQWSVDVGFEKEVPVLDGLVDLTILRKLQGGAR